MKTNERGQTSGRSRQTDTAINICVLLDDISQPDLIESALIHLETFGCIYPSMSRGDGRCAAHPGWGALLRC